MAKNEIVITGKEAADLVVKYKTTRNAIEAWNLELEEARTALTELAGINEDSDFEGTVNLKIGLDTVELVYAIDRKVDMAKAADMIMATNLNPEDVFNVKWEYSKTKVKTLSEEENRFLENALTYKRKKTSFKLK